MTSLVLIPGLLCDRRLWSAQVSVVSAYADIIVADITGGSTVSEMATDVVAQSPPRFALAGFSLGSQVALEIIGTCRERIERLALLSATHGGLLPTAEVAIRRAVETIEQRGLDDYLELVYPRYVASHRAHDAALKRIFTDMAHAVGKETGLRQMHALLAIKTPFPDLAKIRCPTLILGGREDRRTTPEAHQLLHREIPGSGLVLIEQAGHFTPIEQPRAVTDALQHWLTH